jgi:hypothetical protein
MTAKIDVFDTLKEIVDSFFGELFKYAELHPVIALNILCSYYDVMADLIEDTDLNAKRQKIKDHLSNVAFRIDLQLKTDIFVQGISPVTHIIDHQLGGFSASQETEKILGQLEKKK